MLKSTPCFVPIFRHYKKQLRIKNYGFFSLDLNLFPSNLKWWIRLNLDATKSFNCYNLHHSWISNNAFFFSEISPWLPGILTQRSFSLIHAGLFVANKSRNTSQNNPSYTWKCLLKSVTYQIWTDEPEVKFRMWFQVWRYYFLKRNAQGKK